MLTRSGAAASIARVVVASWVVLGQAACVTRTVATPAAPWRPPRAATLEEVVAAYDGYCRGVSTLSAAGDLEVRDLRAGKARRLGVRVLAGRGGRLYLKGSVAVVTALEVIADGRRFWFRVPSKKTVWTGAADAAVDQGAESEQAPYYALRAADLVEALLPEPLTPEADEALLLDGDAHSFGLSLARLDEGRHGSARRRVQVDRETLQPSLDRRYEPAGIPQREVRYSGWRDGSPHHVVVTRLREGLEAEFTLDEVKTNVTLPERAFAERPAEGYTVVEVGPKA
jgi:hypothetical protein